MSGKKPYGYIPKSFRDIRPTLHLCEPMDGKTLKKEREMLGLTQGEIAATVGVTNVAISHIERGLANNPWALQMYTLILERYKMYLNDYVPVYRKNGTDEFVE